MKDRTIILRSIGIVCIITGLLTYAYSQHRARIYYYTDCVRSTIATYWSSHKNKQNAQRTQVTFLRIPPNEHESFIRLGHFLFYVTSHKTTIRNIAQTAISYTSFYTVESLSKAIQQANGIDSIVPANSLLIIPNSLPPYVKSMRNTIMPHIPKTVGLYYRGDVIGKQETLEKILSYRETGINAIVFDAKDVCGIVNYKSTIPLVICHNLHEKAPIENIDFLVRILKDHGIYIIARISVFRDHLLYKKVPEYAIRTRDGKPWNQDSNELWCDPTNIHVQEYAIALAEELADKGVDEIQFDYIRFPTIGGISQASFVYHTGKKQKEEIIENFLERAHQRLIQKNVRLSVDLFGIIAWEKDVDVHKIGQRIERLAKFCDVISPMLYPSHFNDNFDGIKNPGDNPYYFVFEGTKKFKTRAGSTIIRPWLQAFRWRVSGYNEKYIIDQIRASDDAGGYGYLFWNAANNYDTVFSALNAIKSRLNQNNSQSIEKISRK